MLEQQLREAEAGIENMLRAIQLGVPTKSTKTRLEELEAGKERLELEIAEEKIGKPQDFPRRLTREILYEDKTMPHPIWCGIVLSSTDKKIRAPSSRSC